MSRKGTAEDDSIVQVQSFEQDPYALRQRTSAVVSTIEGRPNKDLKASQDAVDVGSEELPPADSSEMRYTQEELDREKRKKALLQSHQRKKLRVLPRPSINTYQPGVRSQKSQYSPSPLLSDAASSPLKLSSRVLGAQAAAKSTVKSQAETESGTKDLAKSTQTAKKGVDQRHVRDMQDRMEKVTGINKSLQNTILKEYKPDKQLEEYYRRRLQTLSEKYQDVPQSACPSQGSSNRLVKRILRSRAHRLALSPSSATLANAAQIQHNQNLFNHRRK